MAAERPYIRRFCVTLVVLAALLPLLAYAAWRSVQSMHTSPTNWVPRNSEQRQEYVRFLIRFEREDAVIVSWPGCTIDDERLDLLQKGLRSQRQLIERVVTGRSLVQELTSPPLNLSTEEAARRLQGTVVGPDGKTTCAMIVLTRLGADRRDVAIQEILDAARTCCQLDRDDFHVAGPPVWAQKIDEESVRSIYFFTVPSVLVSIVLCWFCLRRVRYTLVVIATAALGQLFVLALVWLRGETMNAVLIVMPGLIFVLVVSTGIHLMNYYLDDMRLHGHDGSVRRALRIGTVPCALAVLTTVIGLASLLVSSSEPIQQFGTFSSIALVATVGVAFLILPGTMQWWPATNPGDDDDANGARPTHRGAAVWDALHDVVWQRGNWIAGGFLLVMMTAAPGLLFLTTSADVLSLIPAGSRVVRDVTWLREHVAPLVSVEVILDLEAECSLNLLERIELVRAVEQELAADAHVSGTLSAATFAPDIPPPGGFRQTLARSAINTRLVENRQRLVETPYVFVAGEHEAWRVSARVAVPENLEYGEYLHGLQNRVERVLETYRKRGATGLEVSLTGGMPLADSAHRALLNDLGVSFITALTLVALVMILILRNPLTGLASMFPNVFPVAIVFGVMGWTGMPVDIGTVMTASIALGIAVDGTLHFLNWFRRETAAGAEPHEAVRKCLRHCGNAIAQTTLICGLGLLVFALSGFVPTQKFAWMMLVLLLVALAGDLFLLPSLLIGPVGKLFVGKRVGGGKQQDDVRTYQETR